MSADFANQKHHAHGLIERLAPEKLTAVVGLLEVLLDPMDRTLASAEIDDEPLSEEQKFDIEASREWFEHNQGIPYEQVVADDRVLSSVSLPALDPLP